MTSGVACRGAVVWPRDKPRMQSAGYVYEGGMGRVEEGKNKGADIRREL